MAVARHAPTCRSKGQRSHGYENRHARMAASEVFAVAVVLLLQA